MCLFATDKATMVLNGGLKLSSLRLVYQLFKSTELSVISVKIQWFPFIINRISQEKYFSLKFMQKMRQIH